VPTILLARHRGHGAVDAVQIPDAAFADHLAALAALPDMPSIGAVLSGYLASPAQASAVANFVGAVKAARPDVLYLCDPVIGDTGALYIEEATAAAIRDLLLPLADIATPTGSRPPGSPVRNMIPTARQRMCGRSPPVLA